MAQSSALPDRKPPRFPYVAVGAMGVFVFSVALRHWLRERRRFREEARA